MTRRDVVSEVSGRVWKIEARPGERVSADDPVIVLESMKMEIPVPAPVAGTVVELRVAEKDSVAEGQVVAVLEA